MWRLEVWLHIFLILALDGGEWLTTGSEPLYPGKESMRCLGTNAILHVFLALPEVEAQTVQLYLSLVATFSRLSVCISLGCINL